MRVSALVVPKKEGDEKAFREYTDYDPVPLAREDATWDLDDLHVHAQPGTPVRRRIEVEDHEDDPVLARPSPAYVEALWTAAQVAATTLALGAYVTSTARKWRDKKTELPEGTRLTLTLTLTPGKKDHRRQPGPCSLLRSCPGRVPSFVVNRKAVAELGA